jgi:hypothetical protein
METMHAAGRRTLPPVPRAGGARAAVPPATTPATTPAATATTAAGDGDPSGGTPTERFLVDLTTGEQRAVTSADAVVATADAIPDEDSPVVRGAPVQDAPDLDAAQQFVALLRAAAPDFAVAAGAASAVVREAVPPARHRRARCRVVLRYADDAEVDVTFLGAAGRPGGPSRHGFDRQIRRWLTAGQRREDAWIVSDPDAPDGLAVDLSAWAAAA